MNDLLFFIAGGIWVFILRFLVSFVEYINDKLKEKKNDS